MAENIFDTHAHYADRAFDSDRDRVLSELPQHGVKYVMLASSDMDDIVQNARLAERYDYIYAASGIHPEFAAGTPNDYIDLVYNTASTIDKIKAIGEIGLDYHYEGYDREAQIKLFEEQLALAKELSLPVIIHSRDAWEDTMRILKKHRPRGIIHCFSGSAEIAAEVVRMGMYVGFTGVITFKNAKKNIRALEAVPIDRLLMETDCPYMAPHPYRSLRSDSTMIAYTAEKAAEVKGYSTQELLDITCANGMEIYSI